MEHIQPIQPPAIEPVKPKSKFDILSSFKKMVEKNGLSISEDVLIKMFGMFGAQQDKKIFSLHNNVISLDVKMGDTAKQVIKIFPKKTVYIDKYDESVSFDDLLFDQMIENFNNNSLFKPYVDIEHKLGEKYADITQLIKREDGLFAEIQLNELGLDAISKNKYSYISPQWGDRTDTEHILHSNVLWAATLTNVPALEGELPKLQEQIRLTKNQGGTMDTKELSKKAALLEGKASTMKLQEDGGGAESLPVIMEAVQMIREAVAKIDEVTQQKDVAEEEAMQFKKTLAEIEQQSLEKEQKEFFELMVKDGKLQPAEVDEWSKHYATSKDSKEFVKRTLSSRPGEKSYQLSVSGTNENHSLSKEDIEIAESTGWDMSDPKEVKRYKKEVLDDLNVYSTHKKEA